MPQKAPNLWDIPADREKRIALARQTRRSFIVHSSGIASLYEEFNKLTKKSPGDPVSDLALATVNATIRDAKHLLNGDPLRGSGFRIRPSWRESAKQ